MEQQAATIIVLSDKGGEPGVELGTLTSDIGWGNGDGWIRDANALRALLGAGYGDTEFHLVIPHADVRLARCVITREGGPGDLMRFDHFGAHPWP